MHGVCSHPILPKLETHSNLQVHTLSLFVSVLKHPDLVGVTHQAGSCQTPLKTELLSTVQIQVHVLL